MVRDWPSKRRPICAFGGAIELPFYLVFAVLCAIVGYVYVLVFYGLRDQLFHKLPMPRFVKPAIGGFLLGCLASRIRN